MAYQVTSSGVMQTAVNAASTMTAAFVTAGLLPGEDEAIAFFHTTKKSIFEELSAQVEKDNAAMGSGTKSFSSSADSGTRVRTTDGGNTVLNFGAFKGLSISQVDDLSPASAEEYTTDRINEGWQGSVYKKSGRDYVNYLANSKKKELAFVREAAKTYLESLKAGV